MALLSSSARRLLRSAASQRLHIVPGRFSRLPTGRWARQAGAVHVLQGSSAMDRPQRRGMAMHASILNRMELLSARYDELATELSKWVNVFVSIYRRLCV